MSAIYIVATKSDEYSNEAILRDLLEDTAGLESFNSQDFSRNRAFYSFAEAQAYHDSLKGKPAFSDGSGDLKEDTSIYEVNLSQQEKETK